MVYFGRLSRKAQSCTSDHGIEYLSSSIVCSPWGEVDDSSNSESSSTGVVGLKLEVGSVVENSAVTALVLLVLVARPKLPER